MKNRVLRIHRAAVSGAGPGAQAAPIARGEAAGRIAGLNNPRSPLRCIRATSTGYGQDQPGSLAARQAAKIPSTRAETRLVTSAKSLPRRTGEVP